MFSTFSNREGGGGGAFPRVVAFLAEFASALAWCVIFLVQLALVSFFARAQFCFIEEENLGHLVCCFSGPQPERCSRYLSK